MKKNEQRTLLSDAEMFHSLCAMSVVNANKSKRGPDGPKFKKKESITVCEQWLFFCRWIIRPGSPEMCGIRLNGEVYR